MLSVRPRSCPVGMPCQAFTRLTCAKKFPPKQTSSLLNLIHKYQSLKQRVNLEGAAFDVVSRGHRHTLLLEVSVGNLLALHDPFLSYTSSMNKTLGRVEQPSQAPKRFS